MSRAKPFVLLSCEHGGNRVPRAHAALFREHRALLESHRGWDPGTLSLARYLARTFEAPLIASTTTRLLVELNRSIHHRALFSEITRRLDAVQRRKIIEQWYRPHRTAIESAIRRILQRRNTIAIHIGVHSFTPSLGGVVRRADFGLLYDPARRRERTFCSTWQRTLRETLYRAGLPERVRRNDPYRGNSDGLTTALRAMFPPSRYLGLELEVNQRLLSMNNRFPNAVCRAVAESLQQALAEHESRW